MSEELPKVTHEGSLDLNGIELKCYNLDTGDRVLSRESLLRAIGRKGNPKYKENELFQTPTFLRAKNLKPFINSDLVNSSKPIVFERKGGAKVYGYLASSLPAICYVFIDAAKAGELNSQQLEYANRCEVLIRGFATVGIISLVDEATGYQYDREAKELQVILNKYISKELLPWAKRFPDQFYQEIFRLNGWDYTVNDIKKRPGVIGIWTNRLIYEKLPKGVLQELKDKTPKTLSGNKTHRFHQLLTLDIGQPDLQRQLSSVITIMKLSKNWNHFIEQFEQLYGQTSLELDFDEPEKETGAFDDKLTKALNYNPKKDK